MPVGSTSWKRVGQGPTMLAVGGGGDRSAIFSLAYHFFHHLSRRQLHIDSKTV